MAAAAICSNARHPVPVNLALHEFARRPPRPRRTHAAHFDAEAGEHELHAFEMLRRLDEIFCANFMVFHDLVREEAFDVWIADEARELDYFLHENPELKTAPYVWLTHFVGALPMLEGGDREAFLAADHSARMVEHVARRPRLRDRSIFIGDPEDVVPERLGPGMPSIRAWTRRRFTVSGYVTGYEPPRSPTAVDCVPTWATRPTRRCASWRPAAPRQAALLQRAAGAARAAGTIAELL